MPPTKLLSNFFSRVPAEDSELTVHVSELNSASLSALYKAVRINVALAGRVARLLPSTCPWRLN